MANLTNILIPAGIVLIALITIGLIIARLYKRASKEVAFVRTGFGGQRVVKDGGALVLPVLHETIPVNMNTLRLEVRRANEGALITRDRMRVDVTAEFYVRAKPDADAIASAAQTLGLRTMDPESLKELVEGKFVDALRGVAAEMAMEELHENRVNFVQKVQTAVAEDLNKNGLELETVSLTGLDQTSKDFFNPNNAFDAQGLTKLTEEIELRRKLRNDIERDTQVQVERKNLDTEKQSLEITRDAEYARLDQQQEVETRKARVDADIKREQAEQLREAESARINSERDVQLANIAATRSSEQADIEKAQVLEERRITQARGVRLTEQEKDIAVSAKSEEESAAKAKADTARAQAVEAEERVKTVREVAQAERDKQVELVAAREAAEKQAIGITVAAESEKAAAEDHAQAIRISAAGDADAVRARASADEERYRVEAEGQNQINEARNRLNAEQVRMEVNLELIRNMPSIIEQSVKPMEAIEGIKIFDVRGLGGNGGGSGGESNGAGGGNLADQMVNSALRYRAHAPLLDQLLGELGLENPQDLNGLLKNTIGTKAPGDSQDDTVDSDEPTPKPDTPKQPDAPYQPE